MNISIHIDTDQGLSDLDKSVLRALVGDSAATEPVAAPKAPVKAPAKAPVKAAPVKEQAPEPEVAPSATETTEAETEPTPEPEDTPEPTPEPAPKSKATSTDLPVMELLVKQAAELISSGERARVKVALDAVGAARVSNVTPEQADAFMKALG